MGMSMLCCAMLYHVCEWSKSEKEDEDNVKGYVTSVLLIDTVLPDCLIACMPDEYEDGGFF